MKRYCVRHVSLLFVYCYLEFNEKKKQTTNKKTCFTNWWLILGKCIETAPGRHQEALPIWPWLLQCIQCCQESKSVITVTQCMKHPHSFAFYFLYSLSEVSPAAGCSLRAHKARATRRERDRAPEPRGHGAQMLPFGSSLLAQHLAGPHIPPLPPHSAKATGQHRAGSLQRPCSCKCSARREGSLLFQVTQWQIIHYYGAAPFQQCTAGTASCARWQYSKQGARKHRDQNQSCRTWWWITALPMRWTASSINEMQVRNSWHRALEVLNWERETATEGYK